MSKLHHEDMLLQIFDEVCEAFPYLDEEKQIEIANNRFKSYVSDITQDLIRDCLHCLKVLQMKEYKRQTRTKADLMESHKH